MTAVVGIMNKRGIAIAADSAVTITNEKGLKIANSANKMLRLSSTQPVSVMVVGNACFLNTYWDIILRRYRQKRGKSNLPSVEAYVEDFLAYISTEKQLSNLPYEKTYVLEGIHQCFDMINADAPCVKTDDNYNATNLNEIMQAFHAKMAQTREEWKDLQPSPAFKDYTLKAFKKYASGLWNQFVKEETDDFYCPYPKSFFSQIKDEVLEFVLLYLTKYRDDDETVLVFSGFGIEEEYPSLIAVRINEGFDGRVCYRIQDKDRVHISEKNETAICPYAQSDIMLALLTGVNPRFKEEAFYRNDIIYDDYEDQVRFFLRANDKFTDNMKTTINKVKYVDLRHGFKSFEDKLEKASWQTWLKALKNYDLQDMAHLAENLVALTSFERHMTFQEEGVGGPIDLAIITKNNGFVWLNRKSWYNHQDVRGQYGRFGV